MTCFPREYCTPTVTDISAFAAQYALLPGSGATTGAPSTGVEAASYVRVTVAGTIPAGAKSITIANLSAAIVATVDGTTLDPQRSLSWNANPGKTLDAVAYNPGSGGELAIITVV